MELFDIEFKGCKADLKSYKDEILFDTTSRWDWEPSAVAQNIYFEYGDLVYTWELTFKQTGEKIPFIITQEIDSQDYAHDLEMDMYSFDVDDIDEEDLDSDLDNIMMDSSILDFVDQTNISNKALNALKKVENDDNLNNDFWTEIWESCHA